MTCNCSVSKSTANVAVSSTNLLITPSNSLSPENQGKVSIKIINSVPATGAALPVTITLNGTDVPVYDKCGNIVYGYELHYGIVLKGYYGNNGTGGTSHLLVINHPLSVL